jgi:hypothetical protein
LWPAPVGHPGTFHDDGFPPLEQHFLGKVAEVVDRDFPDAVSFNREKLAPGSGLAGRTNIEIE